METLNHTSPLENQEDFDALFADMEAHFSETATGAHVPEAEQSNFDQVAAEHNHSDMFSDEDLAFLGEHGMTGRAMTGAELAQVEENEARARTARVQQHDDAMRNVFDLDERRRNRRNSGDGNANLSSAA